MRLTEALIRHGGKKMAWADGWKTHYANDAEIGKALKRAQEVRDRDASFSDLTEDERVLAANVRHPDNPPAPF